MRRLHFHTCVFAALLLTLSAPWCPAQNKIYRDKAVYFTIQVPEALGTYPMALNNALTVTGYYLLTPVTARAFLQDRDGKITTFSVPDSIWTEPESINTRGEITGFYEITSGRPQGSLRRSNGEIITFEPPGQYNGPPEALPVSINDEGEIAGSFPFPLDAPNGFIRTKAGVFSEYDFTDEGADYGSLFTSINDRGTVVGYNALVGYHSSFALDRNGNEMPITFPAEPPAGYTLDYVSTTAESISAKGAIAGLYELDLYCISQCGGPGFYTVAGGFLRSPQGTFTAFNAPGTIVTSPQANVPGEVGDLTAPNRLPINRSATVTGSYTDTSKVQHGFVRDARGTITSFDPPQGIQTTATGINDFNIVVGTFHRQGDPQTVLGFLRLPI